MNMKTTLSVIFFAALSCAIVQANNGIVLFPEQAVLDDTTEMKLDNNVRLIDWTNFKDTPAWNVDVLESGGYHIFF